MYVARFAHTLCPAQGKSHAVYIYLSIGVGRIQRRFPDPQAAIPCEHLKCLVFPVNGTDRLFRVNEGQAHTTQEGWEPDKTPAMFTVIDEEHTGTQDDPIPAAKGMEYTYGLYYTDPEDGKLYRCERTGEQPGGKVTLQFLPHELVGLYFTEV